MSSEQPLVLRGAGVEWRVRTRPPRQRRLVAVPLAILVAYFDDRSPERELALVDALHALQTAAARRAPSQHDQAGALHERLTAAR